MANKKIDYHKFYTSCANNNLTNKKYLPVKNQLFTIIQFYDQKKFSQCSIYHKNRHFTDAIFTQELLDIFDHIIDENAYDELDYYINTLLSFDVHPYNFAELLSVMLFKNKYLDAYYDTMITLCCSLEEKMDLDTPCFNRILDIVRIFLKYKPKMNYNAAVGSIIKISEYETLASSIIGDFYLTDLDIQYLDHILAKSTLNDMLETLKMYNTCYGKEQIDFKQKVLENNPFKKVIK